VRFILVKCACERFLPFLKQWRATHVKDDGDPIDMFFYAPDEEQAKAQVRRHFPEAHFSHEALH
jgi:hypothetical protein